MSISGPGAPGEVVLKVAVSYRLVLRILRELDDNDPAQRAIIEELIGTLPDLLVARVEMSRMSRDDGEADRP